MADDLAAIPTIEQAWRPLTTAEQSRATYYLGMASRAIRRRWPDVDQRIANDADRLSAEDVSDVVVQMVLSAVDGSPVRGAKSFSKTGGPMSFSATFATASTNPSTIEDWMVEIFEGRAAVEPRFWAPQSGRYESIFEWPEEASR